MRDDCRYCKGRIGLDELEIDGLTRGRLRPSSTHEKSNPERPLHAPSNPRHRLAVRENSRRGTTLFGKLFTTLTTTALFIFASAGLSGLAVAEDTSEAANQAVDLARGEQLFTFCTQCHGTAGGGNSQYLAPSIAGLPAWYVDAQLKKFQGGIRGLHRDDRGGLRMVPMSRWLRSESDRKAVSAYIASMARVVPPRELAHHPGDATKGQGYFAVCTACHGADGTGNQGMGAPPLVGMSDWYMYSSIQKFKSGIRGSNAADTNGQVMRGMVATLPDDAAVRDVIAHIQTLEKK